jgi:hypothetical protein
VRLETGWGLKIYKRKEQIKGKQDFRQKNKWERKEFYKGKAEKYNNGGKKDII